RERTGHRLADLLDAVAGGSVLVTAARTALRGRDPARAPAHPAQPPRRHPGDQREGLHVPRHDRPGGGEGPAADAQARADDRPGWRPPGPWRAARRALPPPGRRPPRRGPWGQPARTPREYPALLAGMSDAQAGTMPGAAALQSRGERVARNAALLSAGQVSA